MPPKRISNYFASIIFLFRKQIFLEFLSQEIFPLKKFGSEFFEIREFFRGNISFNPMSSEAALEMSPSGQTNCLFIVLFIQKFQNIPKNSPLLSFSFFFGIFGPRSSPPFAPLPVPINCPAFLISSN